MDETSKKLERLLKNRFGFDSFRLGQFAIIRDLLNHRHVVSVQCTGAGKSLCFQLPGLYTESLTIVVCPLISLMTEQVARLVAQGIQADCLHSGQSHVKQGKVFENLRSGTLDILYVAPERFRSRSFQSVIEKASIGLLAIDEAHCVSEWGHDFRPDYQFIRVAIETLKPKSVLACTATASKAVLKDIERQLNLRNPIHHIGDISRPNLHLNLIRCDSESHRERELARLLKNLSQGECQLTIIYVNSRKQAHALHTLVRNLIPDQQIGIYHAGLSETERAKAQGLFEEKALRIMIATSAFGLGIDQPDVRCVVHYETPHTLSRYYQEVGRAGRSGAPAAGVLLYRKKDMGRLRFKIEASFTTQSVSEAIWIKLQEVLPISRTVDHIARCAKEHRWPSWQAVLRLLTRLNLLKIDASNRIWLNPNAPKTLSPLSIDWEKFSALREHQLSELAQLRHFVSGEQCLNRELERYFNTDTNNKICPGCSVCCHHFNSKQPNALHLAIYHTIRTSPRMLDAADLVSYLKGSFTNFDNRLIKHVESKPYLGTFAHLPAHTLHGTLEAMISAKVIVASEANDHLSVADDSDTEFQFVLGGWENLRPRLIKFRSELAEHRRRSEQQIMPDQVVDALCLEPPKTKRDFLNTPRLGLKRWNDYGEELIELIKTHHRDLQQAHAHYFWIGDEHDVELSI